MVSARRRAVSEKETRGIDTVDRAVVGHALAVAGQGIEPGGRRQTAVTADIAQPTLSPTMTTTFLCVIILPSPHHDVWHRTS